MKYINLTEEEIEKINKLALDVVNLSRNVLVVNLRFMDSAISRLLPIAFPGTIAVDGEYVLYDPIHILEMYKKGKEAAARAYLHMVMHCIFQHFAVNTLVDKGLWNLACDIAVENVINELYLGCVTTGIEAQQQIELEKLGKEIGLITAEKLYRHFLDGNESDRTLERYVQLFSVDDHNIWYNPFDLTGVCAGDGSSDNESGSGSKRSRATLAQMWKDISEQLQMDLESFSKEQGDKAGNMIQNLREVNREKYDYAEFLKKFAVMGEVMKINDDEFDYIFYTYGLNMYGKMPLIEPLEYKEVKRVKEFVIAIDTSGSVQGETVQAFLQKTYNILEQQENFFTKINLHIIQCDADIQEVVKITCKEEFDDYIKSMQIKGLGGTDFRPVFHYVNEMIAAKEFKNLKGLIYFTDGYGDFPASQPDYNTAFIFLEEEYNNPDVPVWAIKLVLRKDEI